MSTPMDMRFPDTMSAEDIERTISAAHRMVLSIDKVGGREINDFADAAYLDRFNPEHEQAFRLSVNRGADPALVAAPIEFTDLSWLGWGDWRVSEENSDADTVAHFADSKCIRAAGWLDYLLADPELHQMTEWEEGLSLTYLPHLAKARVTDTLGREWTIPIAPEMAEILANIVVGDFDFNDPNIENTGIIGWRQHADDFIDLALHRIDVLLPTPAEFDDWLSRYRSREWQKVHLS